MRALFLYVSIGLLAAATPKEIRTMAKQGPNALPQIQPFLKDPDVAVRVEAVKAITEIATAASIPLLVEAARDNDAEVQIRATDGLVNFYLPGYVKSGLGSSIRRAGGSMKARFSDTNDQVIDPYVTVPPEVIQALGSIASGGASMDSRANAARAIGILRGKAALPDLLAALATKDSKVMYESLIAIQKIRDPSAGPRIDYLLHDLDRKVQFAAIETVGLLHDHNAVAGLTDVLKKNGDARTRRAALTSLAMLGDAASRAEFTQYLNDKDDQMRAAAAEGIGRLRDPADVPALEKAYEDEPKNRTRISIAFALVSDGKPELSEFSPLQFLINNLNSLAYRGDVVPFLAELARKPEIRAKLYTPMETGTRDEKIYLARILAESGDQQSVAHLEKISRDMDSEVSAEGLRALRNLKARL